jgi:hypothetical protein
MPTSNPAPSAPADQEAALCQATAAAIEARVDQALARVERLSRERATAFGIGEPYNPAAAAAADNEWTARIRASLDAADKAVAADMAPLAREADDCGERVQRAWVAVENIRDRHARELAPYVTSNPSGILARHRDELGAAMVALQTAKDARNAALDRHREAYERATAIMLGRVRLLGLALVRDGVLPPDAGGFRWVLNQDGIWLGPGCGFAPAG